MAPVDLSVWDEFPLDINLNRLMCFLGTNLGYKLGRLVSCNGLTVNVRCPQKNWTNGVKISGSGFCLGMVNSVADCDETGFNHEPTRLVG